MSLIGRFLGLERKITVQDIIDNKVARSKLNDFLESPDGLLMTGWILVFEIPGRDIKKEDYFKHAGIQAFTAIGMLDQMHHRVQHEGLENYD